MSQPPTSSHRNRLAAESSPYLQQHASNPVDWYPWGEEAFARAREEDKAILLSVGYSACHWCHVMAHESFEDEATAALMNEHFINVKVDREERPDVDEVYMSAVQLMTRHGGWPMTVFLAPSGEPFFGGTYFPPHDRHGIPSFRTVLQVMADGWRNRREEVMGSARTVVEHIRQMSALTTAGPGEAAIDRSLLDAGLRALQADFDWQEGGFGGAPKFPSPMSLSLCLRRHLATGDHDALQMVVFSLGKMANGGIYDQVGGGFHRYSVDRSWLVPHFEKMLYDNALLLRLYVDACALTDDLGFERTARGILKYLRREMTHPAGGFYSAQDADSEGEEGKFYVWSTAELEAVLGDEAALIARVYGATGQGNFEGSNILHLDLSLGDRAEEMGLELPQLVARLDAARERLYAARRQRVEPLRDEKILAFWNGLMLGAVAHAARLLASPSDLALAVAAGEYLWDRLWREDRLLHGAMADHATLDAYLDDVAALGLGYFDLYQASLDPIWLDRSVQLADYLLANFEDLADGGFFFTAHHAEALIARSKNPYDNAVPSGNALAVHLLQRLAASTGAERFPAAAERTLGAFASSLGKAPRAFTYMLEAVDAQLEGFEQVVILGAPQDEGTRQLVAAAQRGYAPNRVVILADPADPPAAFAGLLAGKTAPAVPTAYVCRKFACQLPVTTVAALEAQLGGGGAV